MAATLGLFDWEPVNPIAAAARKRFNEFDQANPRIYLLFKRFAEQALNSGRTHFGARLIAERIRWEIMIETKGDDFKLNDHYTPFYVRKLISERPEYADIFELRSSLADMKVA